MEGSERVSEQDVKSRSVFAEFLAYVGRSVRKDKPVLHPSMGGGPQGLGDPDSTYMRTVELNILIPERVTAKAKTKCVPQMEAFAKCGARESYMVMLNCREEAKDMETCLEPWVNNNEAFTKLVTEEYLQERSDYRRTGVSKKDKKNAAKHDEDLRKEVLKRLESKNESLGNTNTNNSGTDSNT